MDKYGYTPLHIALERYRPLEVIKLLIDTNPNVLSVENYDDNVFSPIDLFNKVWHKGIQKYLQSLPVSISPNAILSSEVCMSEIVYNIKYIHDVTCLLIKFGHSRCAQENLANTDESCRLVLHSVLSNRSFSWPFCELFLRLYACEIDKVDNDGNYPFHYMVQSSRKNIYNKIFPSGECADSMTYVSYAMESNNLCRSDDLEYFQALYILMTNKPELCLAN